jgi:predicted RNase H-like HicB family nuclease
MRCGDILYASSSTPAILMCSASPTAADAFLLDTRTADVFTTAVSASSAAITSNLICRSRRQSNGIQRSRWTVSRPSVSMAPAPAPPRLASEPPRLASEPPRLSSEPLKVDVPPAKPAPKASKSDRIALAIDSLNNYELIKPIPVLIESLGDKVFVAESPDLNVSTTGNSVGAAFLLLKEQIITTYEGHRTKKGSDSERARQVAAFEEYIGKPRRHWF